MVFVHVARQKQVISGFDAPRQAKTLVASLEPATEVSPADFRADSLSAVPLTPLICFKNYKAVFHADRNLQFESKDKPLKNSNFIILMIPYYRINFPRFSTIV
ncbi:hypothetical protein PoB_000430900 [Plakobranchus ocellatus]|uniref:Uncharacterized protein n=1 Tax=Plakobranchus ocellatus TaxID=259542 RepID=A0AAV3Y4B7_9GAST|nr:hypothetical protein PoB_000430900 [Plakobranchus ocellatus]